MLGAVRDFGLARLGGIGLGNSFFSYFHAFILSKEYSGRLIYPAWPSLKLGPILRGEARKRSYMGLFHPTPDEIAGTEKYLTLAKCLRTSNYVTVDDASANEVLPERLNLVSCSRFTFRGLSSHRAAIRSRFLQIITEKVPPTFEWGRANYIACHVRMGDFTPAADATELNSGVVNKRIPISWYVGVLERLKRDHPNKPILVVSDGHPDELRDLLSMGAELHNTRSDIGDLLALASASILVGSNSTFSRWAAFLGNMPSVWIARSDKTEEMCSDDVAAAYVPVGAELSVDGIL